MRGPRPGLVLALSLLTIAAAYSNALDVGFMWDDHTLIEQNPAAHQLTPLRAFFGRSFWAHPFAEGTSQGYFRPLIALSFAIDWALGDGSPVIFHLTNVLAHLLVCGLIFALALRLKAHVVAAAVVTLGFGLFPRLTESVIWVVGRTDVFAAVFALGALWLELARPGSPGRRVLVSLALLLGLFCKEVTIAVFVIIAAQSLERYRTKVTTFRAEAIAAVPLVLAMVAFVVLRGQSGTTTRAVQLNDFGGALNQLGHLVFLGLTPWFPNAQYGFVGSREGWAMLLGLAFLGGSAVLLWRGAWLWCGVLVSMLSVTVPNLGYLTVTSDRFLYFPIALGGLLLAPRLTSSRAVVAIGLLAVSFAPATWVRNRDWANPIRFWRVTVAQAAPENLGARNGYADALLEAHRVDDALLEFRRLQSMNSPILKHSINLGATVCVSIRGDDAQALRELAALDQNKKRVAFDRPLFLARALEFDAAREALQPLEARFGRDEPLTLLEKAISTASAGWAKASTPLAKAKVYDGLGALGHAQQEYERILASSDSSADDRRAALAWLVIKAPLTRSGEALTQLEKEGAAEEVVTGLRAILEERQ